MNHGDTVLPAIAAEVDDALAEGVRAVSGAAARSGGERGGCLRGSELAADRFLLGPDHPSGQTRPVGPAATHHPCHFAFFKFT